MQCCIKVTLKPHGNCFIFIETSAVPVEGEHAACDRHVHWHLSRHPANHKHLLPGVRVEGGVVDVLGPPQLILCQARLHIPSSERVKIMEWCGSFHIILSSSSHTSTAYFVFALEHKFVFSSKHK